jgi:hypothetical protein
MVVLVSERDPELALPAASFELQLAVTPYSGVQPLVS